MFVANSFLAETLAYHILPGRMGEVSSSFPSEIYHLHHRENLPQRIFAGNVVKVPVGTAHPQNHMAARRSSVLYRNSDHCYHDSVGTDDPLVLHLHNNPIEATIEPYDGMMVHVHPHHTVAGDGHRMAPLVGHFSPSRMGMPMVDSVQTDSFHHRCCPHREPEPHDRSL